MWIVHMCSTILVRQVVGISIICMTWLILMCVTWLVRMSDVNHVTHINESCHAYEWVMSHIWMSHVTHMDDSRHSYEHVNDSCVAWIIHMCSVHSYENTCSTGNRIGNYHATHVDGSRRSYERIMSHIRTSHGTHTNESYHTYALHTWMVHVAHTNESCHTYERVLHTYANESMSWLIHMCNVNGSYV